METELGHLLPHRPRETDRTMVSDVFGPITVASPTLARSPRNKTFCRNKSGRENASKASNVVLPAGREEEAGLP